MNDSPEDRVSGPVTGLVAGMAPPRGNYAHFRRAGPLIFTAGISSRRPDGSIAGADPGPDGQPVFDIAAQTRAVLNNIATILAQAGASLADVVEVSSFLVDMADFAGYNAAYAEFFGPGGPARTTVAVHELPHPLLRVEIKVVAWRPA